MLNKVYEDSFSLRKIDVPSETVLDNDFSLDKVKILDFSNSIDKWEEELLLSDEGFFSLKGKKIQGLLMQVRKLLNHAGDEGIRRKLVHLIGAIEQDIQEHTSQD